MKKTKKILSALLGLSMLTMPVMASFSASAESVSSLRQQLNALEEKNKEYQNILDKTQSDIDEKEAYNEALVNKVAVLNEKISIAHNSIDELNDSIDKKQNDIDKGNEEIADQVATLRSRVRTIYMAGNASDLDIILGAKNFSDFIDKMQLIKTLSNYDKQLIDSIGEKLEIINEQKASLEEDKAELEDQEATLKSDLAELNNLLEENDATLRTLYADSNDMKNALEHAALESEEIENQIKAYYESQKQAQQISNQDNTNNNTSDNEQSETQESDPEPTPAPTPTPTPDPEPSPVPSGSGYTWPVPGFYGLSSLWNEDRTTYNHGAIDIAGGGIMGAQVVAADSGTVISTYSGCYHNWGKYYSCGCGGGYGNYVMIDHGNGKITIYAHLTSLSVSPGQYVSKGQTVGYVGTTGNSTGPHLHFECRYNGVKYNPMDEFPGISYYVF